MKSASYSYKNYWLIAMLCGLLFASCSSSFPSLTAIETNSQACLQSIKPVFTRTLYATQVDVTKNHLSGLLLIKQMPDSSLRLVFTMESGFKFFDFEFSRDGSFKVYYIIDKMDKKAVINTLRKDFEMMLMLGIDKSELQSFRQDSLVYHRVAREGEYDYYITDAACQQLIRAEKSNGKKTRVIMTMADTKHHAPEKIDIVHQNFTFHISLKKLDQ